MTGKSEMRVNHTGFGLVAIASLSAALICTTATADQVIADDLSVQGRACIGGVQCLNPEPYGGEDLSVKSTVPWLLFEDSSTAGSVGDWTIRTGFSEVERFQIYDESSGVSPLTILGGAPSDSLFIDDSGDVGMGTNTPESELHITGPLGPKIILEQDTSGGFPAYKYSLVGRDNGFTVTDISALTTPFLVLNGAPTRSLQVTRAGNITSGNSLTGESNTPQFGEGPASINVARSDGTAAILLQETNATMRARNLLQLTNNGGSYITFENTATSKSWYFVHENNVGGRFMINHSEHSAPVFSVDPLGNMELDGTITTTGSCSVGCDRVFDEDYDLPSISEHANQMWQNKHLPAVGPTPETGKFNLTDKMGRMLNELEKAHIYIAQLHEENQAMKDRLAQSESIAGQVAEIRRELDLLKASGAVSAAQGVISAAVE